MLTETQIDERMQAFVAVCRERGLSVTPQRLVLYKALLHTTAHPSPEILFEEVRAQMPTLSLATVYKTVETLKDLGLVQEVNPLHDRMRLDANMDPHHHLVCVRCRQVIDIHSDDLDGLQLPTELKRGYAVFNHSVQFSGLCPACRKGAQ
jgi:Fur family peroxide stress response transcriptional regulator